jgi:hypothetical protein
MTPLIRLTKTRNAFAVCIDDAGYPASLERWKIYRVVADPASAKHGLIRVVDESGDDYLYPKKLFKLGTLPAPLRRLYKAKAVA